MKRNASSEILIEMEEKKRRESDGSEGLGVIEDGVKLESVVEYLKEKKIKQITKFWEDLNSEVRRRLKYLVNGDEKLSDTFDDEFQNFLTCTSNSWSVDSDENEKIAVFWNNYPKKKFLKVLRRQLSGLCFFHACVVLQHYLVSINEVDDSKNVGMLDIGKYEGSILFGKALEDYLTSPHGGETIPNLKKLCELDATDLESFTVLKFDKSSRVQMLARDEICSDIMKKLEVQPLLVSSFVVMNDFLSTENVSFTIPDLQHWPVEEQRHAMVLVGMRKTKAGDYYFLLQNWWRGRYFIEVSYDYFAMCRPEITLVKKKLNQISSSTKFISFECSLETMADKCASSIDSVC